MGSFISIKTPSEASFYKDTSFLLEDKPFYEKLVYTPK